MLLEKIFQPTWLYIKQHNGTGLKYFGKTIRKDPIRYKGSGTYWNRHLKKHGANISTTWLQLFTDIESLTEFALKFSMENNIVESTEWANLEFENGLSGSGYKRVNSAETVRKRIESNTGKKRTLGQRDRMRQAQIESAKYRTPEMALMIKEVAIKRGPKISEKLRGIPKSKEHKANIAASLIGKTKGVIKSEETKQKMRKPKTPEHRANMRKPKTPEHIAKILETKRLKKEGKKTQ